MNVAIGVLADVLLVTNGLLVHSHFGLAITLGAVGGALVGLLVIKADAKRR